MLFLFSTFEKAMKTTPQEVIYWGAWRGFGKLYNVTVDNGYTPIIAMPGEDVEQRSIETKEKLIGGSLPCQVPLSLS
jgi:hypothetical protein